MITPEKIHNWLFYMGLTKEQFQRVKDDIKEDNRKAVISCSFCASLFWVISWIMSYSSEAYRACRYVYIGALILSILTIIGARYVVKAVPGTLVPIISMFVISISGAGIGIAICQPDVRTATMIAFAILAPTCFIKNTLTDIVVSVITIVVYAILGKPIIQPDIYSWGIVNLIIFSLAGILISSTINKSRSIRFVYEESARELAEKQLRFANYDQMTGLKNRRAYEAKLSEMRGSDSNDRLNVVIFDINGLKKVNDTLGHEAGDELIIAAAECISTAFENVDTIYRTGGDEFCAITDGTVEETVDKLHKLEKCAEEWRGNKINKVSISYGFATNQETSDIDAIVVQADQNMYENKRKHYTINEK